MVTQQIMIKEDTISARIIKAGSHSIKCYDELGENIDLTTVHSFGEEWKSFHQFSDEEIKKIGNSYFDIITPGMVGKDKIAADFGCGTGRWTKYFHKQVGAVAAIDPSEAVLAAGQLLNGIENVQLYKASIDNLPFSDNYFDFGFSLGVLHHIPDTQKAMNACVQKIKQGGYFLVYLYYSLDNRGFLYKVLFSLSSLFREIISKMPDGLKKFSCAVLAVFFYMPFVLLSRVLKIMGIPKKIRSRIPLHAYENTSFYIIRNDALDRFGTPLEQRFSKKQIEVMMQTAGLENIVFSDQTPYWHATGRKK
jgi:ubiquinone/menaquinone biosynthesis C-methylase UbiE